MKNIFNNGFNWIRPAMGEFALSILLSIGNVVCVAVYPYLLSWIVDHFQTLTLHDIFYCVGLLLLSILLTLVIQYSNKIVKIRFETKIMSQLRSSLFHQILRLENSAFQESKIESYTTFLLNDLDDFYAFFLKMEYISLIHVRLKTSSIDGGIITAVKCKSVRTRRKVGEIFTVVKCKNVKTRRKSSGCITAVKRKSVESRRKVGEIFTAVKCKNVKTRRKSSGCITAVKRKSVESRRKVGEIFTAVKCKSVKTRRKSSGCITAVKHKSVENRRKVGESLLYATLMMAS